MNVMLIFATYYASIHFTVICLWFHQSVSHRLIFIMNHSSASLLSFIMLLQSRDTKQQLFFVDNKSDNGKHLPTSNACFKNTN